MMLCWWVIHPVSEKSVSFENTETLKIPSHSKSQYAVNMFAFSKIIYIFLNFNILLKMQYVWCYDCKISKL